MTVDEENSGDCCCSSSASAPGAARKRRGRRLGRRQSGARKPPGDGFTGYETLNDTAKVLAILRGGEAAEAATEEGDRAGARPHPFLR